jgi:hypothetical protein
MGKLRSDFPAQGCRNGHPGPCASDHIGPISLGFTHRPRFQLLCESCNSAKNNRMYHSDVELLKADERTGEEVVSWHSAALWNACKDLVVTDEHARRLSKMMRDNRHSLMHALKTIADAGAYAFLSSLLELERADFDIEFVNLRIVKHLTIFDQIRRTTRTTKYAAEQKARRCRIAFRELLTYFQKSNRNSFVVSDATSDKFLNATVCALNTDVATTAKLDNALMAAVTAGGGRADAIFRKLLPQIAVAQSSFKTAKKLLRQHLDTLGGLLAAKWDDERYVRDLDDEKTLERRRLS